MKVKELIIELQKYNEDLEVVHHDGSFLQSYEANFIQKRTECESYELSSLEENLIDAKASLQKIIKNAISSKEEILAKQKEIEELENEIKNFEKIII